MSQYIAVGATAPTLTATLQDRLAAGLKAATAMPTVVAPAPQQSFLSKYGIYLLGAAAVGGFIWWRRRRAGGRK